VNAQLVREATRDGRRVALLRCYDLDGATVVEAEISPAGGGEPMIRGPYRFDTAPEAFRFVQEAVLALKQLGCSIGSAV
jgi:hypothetical protein